MTEGWTGRTSLGMYNSVSVSVQSTFVHQSVNTCHDSGHTSHDFGHTNQSVCVSVE